MSYFSETQIDAIAEALVERGYLIADGFFPHQLVEDLRACFQHIDESQFKVAGIGRQSGFQHQAEIRSDKIHWIEASAAVTAEFLEWMESLRLGLNQRLYLGLFDYESHFAHYPAGAFYKKHLDAFRSKREQAQPNRILSTVLYLNKDWLPVNGGNLVIYDEHGKQVLDSILPLTGRLVVFLSEKFPHEVLPATRERRSIAGWFRVNERGF